MAIKHEVLFGNDNFGKQKELSDAETVAQMLLNLFLMRKGQLPSMPQLGIDIRRYLYKTEDEINVEELKNQIINQCSALIPYINIQQLQIVLVPYNNENVLYILVPLTVAVEDGGTVMYGFKKSKDSSLVNFNYKVSNEQMI